MTDPKLIASEAIDLFITELERDGIEMHNQYGDLESGQEQKKRAVETVGSDPLRTWRANAAETLAASIAEAEREIAEAPLP